MTNKKTLETPVIFLLKKWKISFLSNRKYFFLSFFLVFSCIFFKFPTLSYQAEVWAEAGTNFLYNALYHDFLTNLGKSDCGYFPLMQRLISLILVQGFGIVESFPIVTQMIALLFISFCAAFINLNYFRNIIPDDRIRFILSISAGLIPGYDLYTFLNFPYFGFLICLLVLFIEKENMGNFFYFSIAALSFLIVCSKAVFVIFLPVYGIFFLYGVYKKNKKEVLFNGIILSGILVQLLFIYLHKNESHIPTSTHGLPAYVILNRTLFSFWEVLITVLLSGAYPSVIEITGFNYIIMFLVSGLLGLLIRKLYLQKKYFLTVFFLCCIYLLLSSAFLNIISNRTFFEGQDYTLDWYHYQKLPFHRWTYIALSAFLVGLCVVVVNTVSSRRISILIVCFLSVQFSFSFYSAKDDFTNGNSNWKEYKKLIRDPDYYIPVNPEYGWAMQKNTELIENTNIHQPDLSDKKLRAILIINRVGYLSPVADIAVYDSISKKQIKAQKLDSGKRSTVYFYFPEKIKPTTIKYSDGNGAELKLSKEDVKFVVAN